MFREAQNSEENSHLLYKQQHASKQRQTHPLQAVSDLQAEMKKKRCSCEMVCGHWKSVQSHRQPLLLSVYSWLVLGNRSTLDL